MPVTCHLAVVLVPWWARVFLHDLSNIKDVFGGPLFTTLDLLAALALGIAARISRWVDFKKAFKYAAVVVIVIAVIATTYLVSRISRLREADSAIKECEGASQYAETESDPNRIPALTGPPRVPSLSGPRRMIVDQGISQMMGHIYFAVQQRFPEFDLRTVSLHFVPQGSDKVWDLVQEGEHMRDRKS